MALFDTVANVVSDTAVELGLGAVSDVYASTNPNIVQMRVLLKRVGRHLAKLRPWRQLLREHTFSTTGTETYNLPADFGAMVDQTGWDRTQDQELGVVSPQDWQYIQASGLAATLRVLFRTYDQTLKVHPSTTTGTTIAFEYLSRYWVMASGQSTGNKDAPTANTDTLLFEPFLLMPALKVAWLQAKGFDSAGAVQEYQEALDMASSSNNGAAPVLSLNGRRVGLKLIDAGSPNGGFGFDGVGGLY